uniref:Uncharacterized protein n=1 Tax=Nelumbo nucifera TaxID=4432 RepID=A0A822YLN9_NELNU|nr:TPA_asm: hypothetical protein HUJ06_012268 [Nelumbo nucifera]
MRTPPLTLLKYIRFREWEMGHCLAGEMSLLLRQSLVVVVEDGVTGSPPLVLLMYIRLRLTRE